MNRKERRWLRQRNRAAEVQQKGGGALRAQPKRWTCRRRRQQCAIISLVEGDGRQREYAVAAGGDGLAEQVSDDRVALAELFGGKGRPTEVIGAIAIDGIL